MIQHVLREIPPDMAESCVAFYGLLGFRRVTPPGDLGERYIWLQDDGSQIHLMPAEGAAPQTGHVALVVGDYETTTALLRDHGHEVQPRREHRGSPRSYVHDPAGNLVELMAWAPGDDGHPS
jgi:catechol 2,3-dioxygenase-like lactoylglutathione lyase family enzyme